jgi:hypothetical protein
MLLKDATILKIVAIGSLTVICMSALWKGIDSTLTGTICAIIGGIVGYEYGRKKS